MVLAFYILAVVFARSESALGKYNGMRGGSAVIFNLNKSLLAALFCLSISFFAGGIGFHLNTLFYSLAYGVFLAVSMVCGLRALSLGSMAITSTVVSFSLIIPTLFGVIFLNESLGVLGIVALLLLAASIVLLNYKKQSNPISGACWFYSIITMIANGMCSVVQKLHQTAYPGEYSSEFMFFGMSTVFILLLAVSLVGMIWKNEKEEPKEKSFPVKWVFILGTIAGVCNGGANFVTLLLSATENASVMFPIISAGNAVGSCLVGYLFFKERLTKLQLFSLALGILSVVLLKI